MHTCLCFCLLLTAFLKQPLHIKVAVSITYQSAWNANVIKTQLCIPSFCGFVLCITLHSRQNIIPFSTYQQHYNHESDDEKGEMNPLYVPLKHKYKSSSYDKLHHFLFQQRISKTKQRQPPAAFSSSSILVCFRLYIHYSLLRYNFQQVWRTSSVCFCLPCRAYIFLPFSLALTFSCSYGRANLHAPFSLCIKL